MTLEEWQTVVLMRITCEPDGMCGAAFWIIGKKKISLGVMQGGG